VLRRAVRQVVEWFDHGRASKFRTRNGEAPAGRIGPRAPRWLDESAPRRVGDRPNVFGIYGSGSDPGVS
jgi:hypothetical protein